ncbi:ABC transporter ATP-binding protein [Halanaerobium salsuginis]|jgi:oligopeptide transport system ATP-binding protein|uniref:Oligopeptide transport system ATP-binding protein n=1 Tax=Halanaerobium salsuginis TaxID=29563 RepID=A0A1I4LEL8_9FIRM|nr:dipeptide ABC transporter ATP-binding protein [Halanaerobium salsuginis]SFL89370.1 oligopeptide transport system ATP-binding protein [Halanaerobium salsuginis]
MLTTNNNLSSQNKDSKVLLKIRNLKKHFISKKGLFFSKEERVKAVDGLNFNIYRGETLGIVGESGCGKSTTGRLLLRLIKATAGQLEFDGVNLMDLNKKELTAMRHRFQMIFQDPFASLNPRLKIKKIVAEPMLTHQLHKADRADRVKALLEEVGISSSYLNRYPHEFSGGQRQRIGIARALAAEPEFIVADEPVAALDVSIQAQILNLLNKLQAELGLTMLFIAHDLSVVQYISDRIGVMYLGKMVELTNSDQLYQQPLHPYTKALLAAIPVPDPELRTNKNHLAGEVPSPLNPPRGCNFNTRCPAAFAKCREIEPEFKEIKPGHFCACHLYSREEKTNEN